MKTFLRIGSMVLALGIICGVIYLGILSGKDSSVVPWFGIASAIAAPFGLSLFSFALFSKDREIVKRLSKVPEIEQLQRDAATKEEELAELKLERARLMEVVQLESRRQAAKDRVESLERDAIRILGELEALEAEFHEIDIEVGASAVAEEIRLLRERVDGRRRGDIIIPFGSRTYRIDRDFLDVLPLGVGTFTEAYFRILQRLLVNISSRRG